MERDCFELEKGIFMEGTLSNFRLVFKGKYLTPKCSCLGYIAGTLIAVKCDSVLVFKPEIENSKRKPALVKIAELRAFTGEAYLKVICGEKSYIIDNNVQITCCNCIRLH